MGLLSDIIGRVLPPPPPPPDPVEVAVDQLIDYYQSNGIAVSPSQQQDGTVHLIDGDGRTVAIVYPDGAIEEIPQEQAEGEDPSAQVCEEPHQSFAQADCDPQTQSCPLYADDGTQTQNASQLFADASPVETPAPPAAREQPQPEPAKVAQGDVAAPEEPGVTDIDEPAMVAAEMPAADPPAPAEASAAGAMERDSSTPPPPAPSADSGLSLAAQPMSAQLCIGADVSDVGPAGGEQANRTVAGIAEVTLGVPVPFGLEVTGVNLSTAEEMLLAQHLQILNAARRQAVGEHRSDGDGSRGTADALAFVSIGERRFETGRSPWEAFAADHMQFSAGVCTSSVAPAFDGTNIHRGVVVLGGMVFSIEADPTAIAEAQKGQGGQPHLGAIGSQILHGYTKKGIELSERVAQADPRRDSGERHGNGGGRDGQDDREDAWRPVAFDGDDDFAPSDLRLS